MVTASHQDRIKSAVAVAAVHALLGYALVAGLDLEVAPTVSQGMKMFDVAEPPLPPPVTAADDGAPDPEGAAAPPNLKAAPAPIVAPPPEIRLPVPSPVMAAPIAGTGSDLSAGASDAAGPGTGAGGIGMGTGSGRSGSGTGGGGGIAVRARQIAGRIVDRDYPRAARRTRAEGKVFVRFIVAANGRPRDCAVVESSGHRVLDAATCDLIQRRYRFRPARDAQGRAIEDVKGWEQRWWLEQRD